jgi:hypothetical protein
MKVQIIVYNQRMSGLFYAIRNFILSDSICPEFVNQMTNRYSRESVESAFLIHKHEQLTIPYLLRKYKGHFFLYPLFQK